MDEGCRKSDEDQPIAKKDGKVVKAKLTCRRSLVLRACNVEILGTWPCILEHPP
jgi:hypothetical protein